MCLKGTSSRPFTTFGVSFAHLLWTSVSCDRLDHRVGTIVSLPSECFNVSVYTLVLKGARAMYFSEAPISILASLAHSAGSIPLPTFLFVGFLLPDDRFKFCHRVHNLTVTVFSLLLTSFRFLDFSNKATSYEPIGC